MVSIAGESVMERYHNIVKIEKIKKCLEQGDIKNALDVAQTINRKKVKNTSDLSTLAEVFFQNDCYDIAREIFLSIYSKNKARRILAQIVHLSIKLNDVENAEKYLEEFKEVAPKDLYCHIFRYNIDKMAGKDIDVLIADLEALKNDSYMENWAYELAKLYHKAGAKDKCIDECSNLILWFGNGVYVEKAKVLKAYYLGDIDLSEIEEKKEEFNEEQIAKQIQSILSEYKAKENAREKDEIIENHSVHEDGLKEGLEELDKEEEFNNSSSEEVVDNEDKLEKSEDTYKVELTKESQEVETVKDTLDTIFDDAKEDVEEHNDIDEIVLKKSEIEAMKKSLLKHVNSLESGALSELDSSLEPEDLSNDELINDSMDTVVEEVNEPDYLGESMVELYKLPDLNQRNPFIDQLEELNALICEKEIDIEELLGNYIRIAPAGNQILQSLQEIVKDEFLNANFIITGSNASGKTHLAKLILKLMRRMNSSISSKLAIIDADRLNQIDWDEKKSQLVHCTLIIEHAANLNANSVENLIDMHKSHTNTLFIYIEDSNNNINSLLETNSEFKKIFKYRIELPDYTVEDYMGFVYHYLTEREYEIEENAFTFLRDKIEEQMMKQEEYSLTKLFAIMQQVIKNAENRSAKQLLYHAQSGNFKGTDLLIIKEQDIDSI